MTEETKKEETPQEEKQEAPKEEAPAKAEKPAASKDSKVNYVHAALLLHSAGKAVTADAVKKVITATGAKADDAQVKAMIASLDGVDIDDAIAQAAVPVAAAAPAAGAGEAKKEEKEEAPEKKAEEAASGLSSLFG